MSRVIFFTVFFGIFYYVTSRVLTGAELFWAWDVLIMAFLALVFGVILSLPLYFWAASRSEHKPWYDKFFYFTYLSLAYVNFIIFFVFVRDLISFGLSFTSTAYDLYNPAATVTLLVLPIVLILAGTLVVKGGVRHKVVTLKFPNLPEDFENFRMLHITDLHVGNNLPVSFIENLISIAGKFPVDAVVFTGDILDGEVARNRTDLERLKKLKSKHGSFFVPGNHEYYWQPQHSIKVFSEIGFRVLINEAATIEVQGSRLQIAGVPDPAAKSFQFEAPDFEKLKAALLPDAFKILLSHQPHLADTASVSGIDLQLSGHTHGGQFFPWNFFVGLVQKYAKGLYRINHLQLYVNQGAGYWGPSVRLGTYCELAEIVLTRGTR